MEEILKSINTMQGVLGSFICDSKGNVLSAAMPGGIDKSMLNNVSRTITQTLGGLATTQRRKIGDVDLVYGQGRFIARSCGESLLCILCVRNINVPLLSLTLNVATKKLAEMVLDLKATGAKDSEVGGTLDSRSQFLNTETLSIIAAARLRGVILQAAGDAAIRLHCPTASRVPAFMDDLVIQLAGSDKQSTQINQVLADLGYTRERAFNVLRGSRNPRFNHPQKQLTLELLLDVMKARLQLDFSESLNLYDDTLPLSYLLLWKLLNTPLDERAMRVVAVLVGDHELGGPGEREKVDTTRIVGLCSADWGWYKTVTENLEKVISWAEKELGGETSVFLERARRLHQLIKDAPKSEGWRLRGMFNEDTQL